MRKIKFRVWHKERKKYYNVRWLFLRREDSMEHITIKNEENDLETLFSRNDEYVLEQYTGLKDKNGVEIYEGDVVKVDYAQGNVYWEYNEWAINVDEETYVSLDFESNKMEIIGNIHERRQSNEQI